MAIKYVWSGATGTGDGSSWANAYTDVLALSGFLSGGQITVDDTIYLAHDHSQTWAVETQLTGGGGTNKPKRLICVNRFGSVPPGEADLRTTATLATTRSRCDQLNGQDQL